MDGYVYFVVVVSSILSLVSHLLPLIRYEPAVGTYEAELLLQIQREHREVKSALWV